ncbi:MAG: nicotinate-nucleotide adenylyltransferase [Roseiflexaceae bacterium]|nr:nicotinate-nucleotide adenylyltransferase [Roseiflexaceae bacterium]
MNDRIGVLGGTFDPVHYGHLAVAEDVRVSLGLKQVLFVPTAQQPFKRDRTTTSGAHRLAMLERACANNPRFVVSAIELDRAGVSYTVTTLEQLREQGFVDICFILGADALHDLPKWHRAADIPELAHIVAVQRPGEVVVLAPVLQALPVLRQRLTLLDGPQLAISSTELRHRAHTGASLRYLTPDPVIEYIDRERLYR